MIYIHKKTGKEYFVHSNKVKMKIGDNWYTAVLYAEHIGDSQIYVRQELDFKEKFEKK